MSKVKIGIIGAGFNGQIGFIENFFKNKDCQIFGLAEARENLRKKVINKYKIKNAYVSHKDLIKDINKYDGIAVITKRDMIGPISSKLLKFGKPVLTEKPMAGSILQSRKLLSIAQKYKTLHKVGYNKIYDEGVIEAKKKFNKIIKNKILGKIIFIKSHRLSGSGYDKKNFYLKTNEKNSLSNPSWPLKPNWLPKRYDKSYEKYLNLYCHNISLLRYFTNEIPKVENAVLSDKNMSTVSLRYKKFNAILETGFFTKYGWDETFEIYFELGSLIIKLPPQHFKNKSATFAIYRRPREKEYFFKSKKSWSFKNQCDGFIKDIKNKKISKNKASEAAQDIELIEKIWKKFLNK